jgi:hypothetical protein
MCNYAGKQKCFGRMCKDSDEQAALNGHPEGIQSDPIENCIYFQLKNKWWYCPYAD